MSALKLSVIFLNKTCSLLPLAFLILNCLLLTNANAFCFEEAGKTYGISPELLEAIAGVESNFTPDAINKNNNGTWDIGIMQINSFWITTFGLDAEKLISIPCYNTMTGAKILRKCIDRYGYTWEAVGCYNATGTIKKVRYSWRIFNELKGSKNEGDSDLNPRTLESLNSSLFFKVRDKITSYEPSAISHEITMEVQ